MLNRKNEDEIIEGKIDKPEKDNTWFK
jgi:hypothetical protein